MGSLPPRLTVLDDTDSTNDAVRAHAATLDFGPGARPVWIAARRQRAGRGRRGRAWVGVEGNLFLSGMLWIDAPLAAAAQLAFAGALAVGDLVDPLVGPEAVRFKWPNDVLLGVGSPQGGKVAGVLLESAVTEHGDGPAGVALVAGLGVNLAAAPAVDQQATSVAAHARGRAIPDVEAAAQTLAAAFEARAAAWAAGGFGVLRDPWLARCAHLGRRVRAWEAGAPVEGVFEDVDARGRLVLRANGARRVIHAGDVELAPAGDERAAGHGPEGAPPPCTPARAGGE